MPFAHDAQLDYMLQHGGETARLGLKSFACAFEEQDVEESDGEVTIHARRPTITYRKDIIPGLVRGATITLNDATWQIREILREEGNLMRAVLVEV